MISGDYLEARRLATALLGILDVTPTPDAAYLRLLCENVLRDSGEEASRDSIPDVIQRQKLFCDSLIARWYDRKELGQVVKSLIMRANLEAQGPAFIGWSALALPTEAVFKFLDMADQLAKVIPSVAERRALRHHILVRRLNLLAAAGERASIRSRDLENLSDLSEQVGSVRILQETLKTRAAVFISGEDRNEIDLALHDLERIKNLAPLSRFSSFSTTRIEIAALLMRGSESDSERASELAAGYAAGLPSDFRRHQAGMGGLIVRTPPLMPVRFRVDAYIPFLYEEPALRQAK